MQKQRRDRRTAITAQLDWRTFEGIVSEIHAARRGIVEKLFGTLKRSYGLDRAPYFTLTRTATALALPCYAFNLWRWRVIATG